VSAPARSCFVVPAAGRGSRLGLSVPKLLAPLTPGRTIWSVLRGRMSGLADHIHVVLSPDGMPAFEAAAGGDLRDGAVSASVQPVPRGMGDAIFGAHEHWQGYENVFVLWGDQLGIAHATLRRVVAAQLEAKVPSLTLPVVWREAPYVQYRFDEARGTLASVLQTREGDGCDAAGFSDVGLFGLSTTGLAAAWEAFEERGSLGARTGEANFLPFLSFLSTTRGWPVRRVVVDDAGEARGVNTPEDLAYFRERLEAE